MKTPPPPQGKAYNFSTPGWQPLAGHFTRLMWRDGAAFGCASDLRCASPIHVCRFAPGGGSEPGGAAEWSVQVAPPKRAGAPAAAAAAAAPAAAAPAAALLGPAAPAPEVAATARARPGAATAGALRALALERTNGYRALHQVRSAAAGGTSCSAAGPPSARGMRDWYE
jgi:hypothetical protein